MIAKETCEVIFRDESLVAINKPSGLLVHRSPIDRHETRFALQLVRDQVGRRVYPVHRLDKPTSGVLLFGLSSDIAREVSAQFEAGTVRKKYLAVVRGHCPLAGRIDHALKEEWDRIADRDRRSDRPAQTALTQPGTGRRHQLRRHMKHIGYPVIGDAKHGKGVHNRFFQSQYQCHRLLLACTGLELVHPLSGETVLLQASLDAAFTRVLQAFDWQRAVPVEQLWNAQEPGQ